MADKVTSCAICSVSRSRALRGCDSTGRVRTVFFWIKVTIQKGCTNPAPPIPRPYLKICTTPPNFRKRDSGKSFFDTLPDRFGPVQATTAMTVITTSPLAFAAAQCGRFRIGRYLAPSQAVAFNSRRNGSVSMFGALQSPATNQNNGCPHFWASPKTPGNSQY
jgi:hypothetical protein